MSKTYRCRVRRDITISVDREEQVDYGLQINDTLSPEETNEILRRVLEGLGGEVRDDGAVALQIDDEVELEVRPAERTATARASQRGEVKVSMDRTEEVRNMADDKEAAQQEAERRVEASIREQVDRETREEVRRRLGRASHRVVEVLREARGRTEKEAVVKQAERLGTIEEVVEETDEATGARSITIGIRIPD